jgi:hypothetical protein
VCFFVLACSGGDDETEPAAVPSATSIVTPRPGSTPAPAVTPEPRIDIGSLNPTLQLKGAFRPPQVVAANPVELPARPKPEFAAWDGASVVVYDTESGDSHNFGPGKLWQPAFATNHLVYTSEDNEVFLVDLRTMEKQFLARGLVAYFLGDSHVVINPGDNAFYAMRVDTRARVELADLDTPLLKSMVAQRWGGAFHGKWVEGRYAIRLVENAQAVCDGAGVEQRICLAAESSKWLVEDVTTGEIKFAFQANKVEPAGPDEIVIATTPLCAEAGLLKECYEVLANLEAQNPAPGQIAVAGTTNIFLVNLTTGDATFVATATYNAATGRWPMSWPLVANEHYVAWTESYCGEPRGATRLFDRATGQIAELNSGDWLALADGRLGLGEQGATAVIDPATLQYLTVLPELAGVNWSRDLRYAAVGQGFGRAGVCG